MQAVDSVTDRLNKGFNRGLGMSPDEVLTRWREVQQKYLAEDVRTPIASFLKKQEKKDDKKVKDGDFSIGQKVFRPYKQALLDKESDRQFQQQVYTIAHILKSRKPFLYKLVDGKKDPVKGVFYAKELRKATEPAFYPVEKIVQSETVGKGGNRRRRHLVRWKDHGPKFDEWIPDHYIKGQLD